MFDYVPNKPDWHYTFINVSNLEKIQKELLYIRNNLSPSMQYNEHYTNYLKEHIVEYIPTLREYLEEVGVYEKLYRIVFSAKREPGQKIQSGIHVDSLDKGYTYSLNIPLVDCENTYTAWYEGPVEKYDQTKNPFIGTNEGALAYFGFVREHLAKEVCRVETTRPMLVNTTIPHRGLTTKPSRVISSIRFIPDLTDEEFNRIITKG
jgi:hypothetical protein